MSVADRMNRLLSEEDEKKPVEIDVKPALMQLALAMDALGLDTKDEDAQEAFIHFLKQMASNKATLKRTLSNYTAAKAAKAVKTAKAAV